MRHWIAQFENRYPTAVICPGFARLRYLAACPHSCSYCFVQGTFSRFGRPRDITEADLPEMDRAVERWMIRVGRCVKPNCGDSRHIIVPKMLNAGELSDSFAPEISAQASLRLIELFRRQHRHTLLLLTKARPTALFEIAPTPQVIISFSLGQQTYLGPAVAPGAPDAASVLESAVRLQQAGWRMRLRIDPLINDTGVWEVANLLRSVPIRWERITLGTLRFTGSGYRAVAHGSPFQAALAARVALEEGEAGTHPYRLPLAQRVGLYAAMIADLREMDATDLIALCKETPEAWRRTFGTMPEIIPCNCAL